MLIDSNILVYSINSSSPKHLGAQQFIQENVGKLEVAHQNIFETLRILTHSKFPNPMKIGAAMIAVEAILEACNIIAPDYRTHRIALALIKKYQITSNQVFDAYLAATLISNGIDTIATDNVKDLQRFSEIKVLNPFSNS
jgi:predicted nucleic acid-binding protein